MVAGASPPTKTNQTPNAVGPESGSQNMWAKLCVRKGNSPDRPLRSHNQDVGLEAAIHLKSA